MQAYLHDSWKVATGKDRKALIGFTRIDSYASGMDHLTEEIGRRLKQARKEAELTLEEAVEDLDGLSVSRLSNWENGTRRADIEFVKKLAPRYKRNAAYLLTLEDDRPSDQAMAVAKAFDLLEPNQQDALITMIGSYGVRVTRPPPTPVLQIGVDTKRAPRSKPNSEKLVEGNSGSSSSESSNE